jgi:hypothetical protein
LFSRNNSRKTYSTGKVASQEAAFFLLHNTIGQQAAIGKKLTTIFLYDAEQILNPVSQPIRNSPLVSLVQLINEQTSVDGAAVKPHVD